MSPVYLSRPIRMAQIKSRLAHPSFDPLQQFNQIIAEPSMIIFEQETLARLKGGREDV